MIQALKRAGKSFLLFYCSFTTIIVLFVFSQQRVIHAINNPPFHSLISSNLQWGEAACIQPPKSVDWTKATDEELTLWGFPPKSIFANNPNLEKLLNRLEKRYCGSKKMNSLIHYNNERPMGITNSPNWAGYKAISPAGTYTAASITFSVPTISATPPPKPTNQVATWVGVGDGVTGALVQTGVGSTLTSTGQQNFAWSEVFPAPPQFWTLLINTGDQISSYVSSTNGYNYFLIKDLTTNTYVDQTSYTALSNGATAECIVEDPAAGAGGYNPFPNFGTISVTDCSASTLASSTSAPIGNFTPTEVVMVRNSATLATPSALTNGNAFTVTWLI